MKPIEILPQQEAMVAGWLKHRGGVLVWKNVDLSSPDIGTECSTAALTEGEPTRPPHWRYGNKPDRLITDPALVIVATRREVQRVKVRRGPVMYGGLLPDDYYKVMAVLDAHPGAGWTVDYTRDYRSPWMTAIVTVPDQPRPLNLDAAPDAQPADQNPQ